MTTAFHSRVCSVLAFSGLIAGIGLQAGGQSPPLTESQRCIIMEVYVSEGQPESAAAWAAATKFASSRSGLRVVQKSVTESDDARQRLKRIAHYYRFDENQTPVIYCCNRVIRLAANAEQYELEISKALQIDVFVRPGCSKCAKAKQYLPGLVNRYPALRFVYRDISADVNNRRDMFNLANQYRKAAVSTPVFHFFNQLVIGFDRPDTTGAKIEKTIARWSTTCANQSPSPPNSADPSPGKQNFDQASEVASLAPF